jgi:uncharacterized protein
MKRPLGTIVMGSLAEGFTMRVDPATNLESLKAGKFIAIRGTQHTFFSLITDLTLQVSHPDILLFPPTTSEDLLHSFIKKKDIYATALIRPLLTLTDHGIPSPVKTLPTHFAPVYEVDAQDVARIFGNEDHPSQRYFTIGYPLDMTTPVCLDLEKLTERSNGIFGKTGTGKTFLTRLVLAGVIKHNKAVSIIFDMHSEYGSQALKESKSEAFVKGLKTLFSDKIAIFSLDPQSTRRRASAPDVELIVTYQSINVDDILSLQHELNLHPTACEAAYLIAAKYKHEWLAALLAHGERLKELALEVGAHPESTAALYRKLSHIERFPFFRSQVAMPLTQYGDIITQMMEYIDRGISIIIEFGNYTSTFCYLLIANIITRRIHAAYIKKTEKFLGSQRAIDEPKKLMIVIEEAHKFLNPQAARQTIFGIIAREMRKYYVALLVVDQRPSSIDPEILSQIGTKIIAQLSDEKDIQAVLTGTNHSHYLRTILSALDSKRQVLLIGHAIPMPIVIESRAYDQEFYRQIASAPDNHKEIIADIF